MPAATVTPVIELVFKPNPGRQTTFLSLPDTIFEALYGGAAGGGKSMALMLLPLLRGWHEHPKFHGLIMRRTFPELEEYMILRSREFYEPCGGKYNQQQKRWLFPSGAVIKFGHAEEENDIRKYDTAEYNYFAPDELTSFTEFQYKYLAFSRVRSSCPDLPAIVRAGTNPGNVGHGWVRKRFIEPCKEGNKILAEKMPDGQILKRIFIPAKVADNPHVIVNDPGYVTRMQNLPEAEKAAKLYGDWWTFSGQVFEEFRVQPFKDEPKEAQHVIDPPEIPSWIPKILAIDWGFQAMTYASWGAAYPNKRAIIYKEYGAIKKTIDQWATDIAELSINNYPDLITLDPSAWQQRGHEETIEQQFCSAWKKVFGKNPNVIKADNDRLSGKMLVHSYLRWKPLQKLELGLSNKYDADQAAAILRLNGLDAYKSYLTQFTLPPQSDEILPRLLISRSCVLMIKAIPLCVYNTKGKNTEDVAEFDYTESTGVGDDPYDNLRYLLKAITSYYTTAGIKAKEIESQQRIMVACESLQETNNQTSFYRKMEFLEAQKNKGPKAISFSRRRLARVGR